MSSEPKQKKNKGRSVPSRYMQSASSSSTQSSSGASSETMKVFQGYGKKSSLLLNATTIGSSNKNETDINLCKKTTSTPDQNCVALPTFDASAISSSSGSFCTSQRKEMAMQSMLSTTTNKQKTSKAGLPTSGPIRCRELKSDPNQMAKMQKLELDVYYGQYQLSLLLENKLRKSAQLRSEIAMEKIYKALSYVRILLGKNGTLQNGLSFVSYAIKLNEHLQKQEEMLLPSLETISVLEKQYEEIAVSVDSIRHKLQVQDVSLSIAGLEEEVIQILEDVNGLLEQIQMNVDNIDEVNLLAKNANTIMCQGKLIAEEIKRGSELVSESRELLLSETSCQLATLSLKE